MEEENNLSSELETVQKLVTPDEEADIEEIRTIRGFLLFSRTSAGSICSSIQSATRTSGRVSTRRLSKARTLRAI
jgi:uncharacterized alpha-E superfamily protein